MLEMVGEALDGWAAFALSGSRTLDAMHGDPDEARKRVLHITGCTGGTINLPAVEKAYLVKKLPNEYRHAPADRRRSHQVQPDCRRCCRSWVGVSTYNDDATGF